MRTKVLVSGDKNFNSVVQFDKLLKDNFDQFERKNLEFITLGDDGLLGINECVRLWGLDFDTPITHLGINGDDGFEDALEDQFHDAIGAMDIALIVWDGKSGNYRLDLLLEMIHNLGKDLIIYKYD